MKVTQEKLPASRVGLEIEIPAEKSKQAYEKTVRNLSRSVKLPGFRPGKTPRNILIQRLGPQRIKAEVLETLIQESLEQAIKDEEIDAIGNYQLVSDLDDLLAKFNPGEPLSFSATVDVPAQIELGEYSGLKATAEKTEYNPQDVEDLIKRQQDIHATLVPIEDRAVQMGDVVLVDYSGRFPDGEDTEEIEGIAAENFQMEVEEGQFVAGFVEGIIDMNIGETKEITINFPDDYPQEELAGKETLFTVTVNEIKEKELPELDDEFAEDVSEFETMAELRESLETQYRDKAERETDESVKNALLEELLKVVTLDLSQSAIDRELDTMLTRLAMELQEAGLDVRRVFDKEMLANMRESSRPEAINNIKRSAALLEIAKQELLEPTAEEIEAKSQEILEELDDGDIDPDRLRDYVKEDLSKERAIEWLKERAEIEYVPVGTLSKDEDDEDDEDNEAAEEATSEVADASTATIDVTASRSEEE